MIGLLIVDDEETTRRGLAGCIDWASLGIDLLGSASNGLEALRELERHHPGIVILDIKMPEMDGMALLSVIRSHYPGTRAILVSGYEEFADAQRAVNLAAFAFLSKPIDEKLLLRAVRDAAEAIRSEEEKVRGSGELHREFERLSPALRTSFLCRLMSSTLGSEEEARAQAALLGLSLPPGFPGSLVASAVLVELSAARKPEADAFARFALAQRASAALAESGGGFAFPFGDWVCLIAFHGKSDRESLRLRCREHIAWAASALGCLVAAGIGRATERLTGLSASFESARQALEYRFMVGLTEAIDAEDLSRYGEAGAGERFSLAGLRTAAARIGGALREKRLPAAVAAAEELLGDLQPRLPTGAASRQTISFLLSFVLTEVAISLGVSSGIDPLRNLASCRSKEELEACTGRFLRDLDLRIQDSGRRRDAVLATKAQEYMASHVFDDISLTAVAEALRIHPNYLSGVFRSGVGKTFIEHEIGVKMDAARKLLAKGDHKVYEVADMLKYRDVNHFTRVFKKHVGVLPSEYQEEI